MRIESLLYDKDAPEPYLHFFTDRHPVDGHEFGLQMRGTTEWPTKAQEREAQIALTAYLTEFPDGCASPLSQPWCRHGVNENAPCGDCTVDRYGENDVFGAEK